jgi:hypothetical protein
MLDSPQGGFGAERYAFSEQCEPEAALAERPVG